MNRLVEEGVDPRLRGVVKSYLDYWTSEGRMPLNVQGLESLRAGLKLAEAMIKDESYVDEIASYAKSPEMREELTVIGINPDKDYEIESLEKYLKILSNRGVDIIPTEEIKDVASIIRRINDLIIYDKENRA